MAVYVDDFYKTGARIGTMKMSHMIADTRDELFEMIDEIGIESKHIQCKNSTREHFDICLSKRAKAIKLGAIAIGYRELAEKTRTRVYEGYFPGV